MGDDLLVTNPERVQKAIDTKACNALLLKVLRCHVHSASLGAVAAHRAVPSCFRAAWHTLCQAALHTGSFAAALMGLLQLQRTHWRGCPATFSLRALILSRPASLCDLARTLSAP